MQIKLIEWEMSEEGRRRKKLNEMEKQLSPIAPRLEFSSAEMQIIITLSLFS